MFFKKNYYILFCRINFVYCKKMIKNILQKCFCINFSNIIKLVIIPFILWEYFYYCINFRRKKSIIIFYSAKLTLFIVLKNDLFIIIFHKNIFINFKMR